MSDKKLKAFQFIENHRAEMLSLWQELVSIESGSRNKAGVDRVAARLQDIITLKF
jgi:glutamate carboxypeptidase